MKNIMDVDVERMDNDEIDTRCKALRNAIICTGWGRVISVALCVVLYILVHAYSKGRTSDIIQIMLLVITIPHAVEAILMFMGAMEGNILVLDLTLWICLIVGCYDAVLGVIGAIYFIRFGHMTVHYILAVIFAGNTICFYVVICHDILIIYAYKRLLLMRDYS